MKTNSTQGCFYVLHIEEKKSLPIMKIIVTASKDDVENKYRKTFNELQHRLMIEHDANNILSLSKELLTA